ncbi:MAG: hypothetical protein OEY86_09035 [Nitrospira sp.]|nr:hypothetical protein [Nitrospira sp.]
MGFDLSCLSILCCPETQQSLAVADGSLLDRVNQGISRGILVNVGQKLVSDQIEAGLVRADQKVLYPIRENIPVLLIEEGIALDQLP